MPATIAQLAADLHRFFAEKVGAEGGDTPGDIVLVFDALGVPLDPREFGARSDGPPLDVFANQRAAELADQLPAGNVLKNGSYLPRTSSRLSRWYGQTLAASEATPADAAGQTAFHLRKAAALEIFDENEILDVAMPGAGVEPVGGLDHHRATSMAPRGWFLPDSAAWSTYSQTAEEGGPPPGVAPPIEELVPIPEFELRLVELDPPPEVERFTRTARELVIRAEPHVDPPSLFPVDEIELIRDRVLVGAGLLPEIGEVVIGGGHNIVGPFLDDVPIVEHIDAQPVGDPPPDGPEPGLRGRLIGRLRAEELVRVVDVSTTRPVETTGFAISFEYTVVVFDRAWWDDVFLGLGGWHIPGIEPGLFATGTASPTASQFITLMTAGMVVVRNLDIRAAWSGDDRAAASSATSLGPFCIAGADWTEERLRRPGFQVIAWLCQVPPKMPPG